MPPINQPTITNEILRPTLVEVNLTRLTENLRAIRDKVAPTKVMSILKANAYGHGLIEIARWMETLGVDMIGVAYLEEGIYLREQGITSPILILGGIIGNQVPLFLRHNLTLTASSIEKLDQIESIAKQIGVTARVHLKIDTGMERIGVHYYSAESLLEASLKCRHSVIEGIYSHFANADSVDLAHARLQIERFHEVLRFYEQHSLPTPLRHIANSAGILQLPESYFDLVRPGILLYGVYPSKESARAVIVRPALSWKSRVVYFKVVQPGHPVSYGSTWESDHPVRVVTIPVGYGDGYFRAMSNQAQVIIRGQKYPVVGRICMDQTMVNIEMGTAYNGDEVILLGETPHPDHLPGGEGTPPLPLGEGRGEGGFQAITAEDLAEWAGTIPYEILTNINTRVPRVYLQD